MDKPGFYISCFLSSTSSPECLQLQPVFLFPFHSRGRGFCFLSQVEVPLPILWIIYPPIALELNIQSFLILKECLIFQEFHLFGIYICLSYTYNNYKQNKTKYTIALQPYVCIHLSLKGGTHCQ